jgi:hypothetical protein
MKSSLLLVLTPFVCALPAFADVTIATPTRNSEVVSPFHLTATASKCSSQQITSMGYSIDSTANPTMMKGSSIDTKVASLTGAHTVYVQSFGLRGAVCESSVPIIVVPDPVTQVPSDALQFRSIQALTGWQGSNDEGISGGSATGTTQIVSSPSLSGKARQFSMQYTNYGGERYWVTFGSNTSVTNFLYDGWIYLARPAKSIANLEMDTDQVMSNGDTVIFAFQCDGYSGTWDYTENAGGVPKSPSAHWVNSQSGCNPQNWSTNTWHHVQISYSRDQYGSVTYQSVWFDGVEQDINATVPSDFALNWAVVLLTNFQIDGLGASGSATVYLDNLNIYAW